MHYTCLIGLCCGICSDVQLRESCWAPECPPRSSGLRHCLSHRCPLPPQRASSALGARSIHSCGGRGAVSRWTTRGSQGVSLQFLPRLPFSSPISPWVSLPTSLPASSFPSFLSLFFHFLFFPSLPFSSLCVELKILL